jgi:hypothetical protein
MQVFASETTGIGKGAVLLPYLVKRFVADVALHESLCL